MIPKTPDAASADLDPLDCLALNPHRLWFSGVLASSWVEPNTYAQLDELLTRLDGTMSGPDAPRRQPVRFLIMNPYGQAFADIWGTAPELRSIDHIEQLLKLARKHPSFAIKAFEEKPQIRLHLIQTASARMAAFSTYSFDEQGSLLYSAIDKATFIFNDWAEQPLSGVLYYLFNKIWRYAVDLEDARKGVRP
jgi:hypothetical protein